MRLIGRKDALALSGIGAGIVAANPWLSGDPHALLYGLPPAFVGGAWLAWKGARDWLDVTDTKSREGFILPSDEVPKESMPDGLGLRVGYTRDQNLPVDIEDSPLMRHAAIIGQCGGC